MELVGQYRRQFTLSVFSIRLPWFVSVALCLLTSLTVVAIAVILAAQREMSNPFSAFSDLFGDDARQAALARGFTCRDTGPRNQTPPMSDFCAYHNSDAMFSGIQMWMSGNRANEISFWVQESTLTLGELELLWGKPEIRLYCWMAIVSWPARHITGLLATPRNGAVSHFSPVQSVVFTDGGRPPWGELSLQDMPTCVLAT